MFLNKQKQIDPAQDDLAKAIAGKIVQWQRLFAAMLNQRANRFSKTQQKWALVILCTITSCGLILCLTMPLENKNLSKPGNSYQSSHIGLPSGQPEPNPPKLTDSLTIKK